MSLNVYGTIAFISHNDQNEVQHDFLSHAIQLIPALLSCHANGITNSTILFFRWNSAEMAAIILPITNYIEFIQFFIYIYAIIHWILLDLY